MLLQIIAIGAGNGTLSERNMVSRSMPAPQPPVGARPCSSATQKSSSCTYIHHHITSEGQAQGERETRGGNA